MSKKFLTPVNLPHGTTLPAVGSTGDLFFLTTDKKVYTHDGTSWAAASGSGSGSLSSLSDVQTTSPTPGDVLLYDSNTSSWVNTSLVSILVDFGLLSADAGLYSTSSVTGTIDGGISSTTTYNFTYDGGNESSF